MIRQALSSLAVVTCLVVVGCVGKTTSLGGPEGNQSSASSTQPAPVGFIPSRATNDDSTGDAGVSTEPASACQAYSWAVDPTSTPCEYLLPPGPPPHGDSRLDPKNWNAAWNA